MATQAVDRDDPRMLQPPGHLGLQEESRLAGRVVRVVGEQFLEGHMPVELRVHREEDLAQSAPGMGTDDPETLVEASEFVAVLRGLRRAHISDRGGDRLRTDRARFLASRETGLAEVQALQRHAGGAQGTTRRLPEVVRQGCEAYQRDAFARGEVRGGRTQDEQGADRRRPGTAGFQGRQGPADRGPRVDDVVHDRDDLATDERTEGIGDAVTDREQAVALRAGELLREGELDIEFLGHHLREKAPSTRGPHTASMRWAASSTSQLGRERPEAVGSQVKPGDLQPEVAVVARLEPEVALPRCQQAEEFFLHRRDSVGLTATSPR